MSYRSSSVQLYDATTGEGLQPLDAGQSHIFIITFSHDRRALATADAGGNVVLWDLRARAIRRTWKFGYGMVPIHDLAFSSDGRYLAIAN